MPGRSESSRGTRRLVASLVCLNVGLAAALLWGRSEVRERAAPGAGSPGFPGPPASAHGAPEAEVPLEALVEALVAHGAGVWDAHPDPDVARVLQPGLEGRSFADTPVRSNHWGLRERELGPKPVGTVRIVLLGDSFVFGLGVAPEERMGVFLERSLRERSGAELDVECLHVGIASWNIEAECAFARRSLGLLEPDLVVQLVLPNDLADCRGTRGFGSKAGFSPQVRERASGLLDTATDVFGGAVDRTHNYLPLGLDHESRTRYERAAGDLAALARAVRDSGAAYLLLPRWTHYQPLAREFFEPVLWEQELAWVSDEFVQREEYWVSPTDFHWNRDGHEVFARFLHGWIEERELLPALELRPWEEAVSLAAEIDGAGRDEARRRGRIASRVRALDLLRALDFAQPAKADLRQLYGGVYSGLATSYASMLLAGPAVGELVVEGAGLGHPGLAGRVRVFAEELEVGSWDLAEPGPFVRRFALPPALAGRAHVSVRFVSDDYVRDSPAGAYVSFRLDRVAIVS